jgi:serine/threonine protein phosphatase PrpC
MVLTVCYFSNIGKVRKNNEDSLLMNDFLLSESSMRFVECVVPEGDKFIVAVADGMGGHMKGEVASRKVLEVFRDKYRAVDDAEGIRDIFKSAKEELNRIAEADRNSFGLGTTVSGMLFIEGKALIFHCGDSRVYRVTGGRIEKMTVDHSVVQDLVNSGFITEEEMRTHPRKNIITSSIMGDLRTGLPELSIQEIALGDGGRFFLCTDGVWESMSGAEMEACFVPKDMSAEADCLRGKALGPGHDNLTMILADVS